MLNKALNPSFDVEFFLTTRCNLACAYCYAAGVMRNPRAGALTAAQMTRAVDILAADRGIRERCGGRLNLGFIGGEPLLEFDAVKAAINHIRAGGHGFYVYTITNGTLLTADKMDFFAKNGVDVCISLDGPRHANDLHRKFRGGGSRSVFDAVIENLDKLLDNPDYRKHLSVGPTFTRRTVRSMRNAMDFFIEKLGESSGQTEPKIDCCAVWGRAGRGALRKALRETRAAFLSGLKAGEAAPEDLLNGLFFVQDGLFIPRGGADCMLADTIITLFPDGRFYPFDLTFTTTIAERWRAGDLKRGIDLRKIDALRSLPEFTDINRKHTGSAVLLRPLQRYRWGKFSGFSREKLDELMTDTVEVNKVFDEEMGQCVKLQMLRRRLLAEPGFGDCTGRK